MSLYVNCVVLRQKDSRWIISSTGKEALSPREASSLSLFSATLTARSAKNQLQTSNALDESEPATGFAVIPYIQGVTEPIKIILNSHNVKVAQKPFQNLGHIFAKSKDSVTKEQRTDAIYSIPCNDCDHEYIGQTKRQFGTRLKEHQKAVFFCKKEKFCFIGAHTPNQPYNWVG